MGLRQLRILYERPLIEHGRAIQISSCLVEIAQIVECANVTWLSEPYRVFRRLSYVSPGTVAGVCWLRS